MSTLDGQTIQPKTSLVTIHFHYKVVGTGATAYLRKVVE
jgi:hypothetical protein